MADEVNKDELDMPVHVYRDGKLVLLSEAEPYADYIARKKAEKEQGK